MIPVFLGRFRKYGTFAVRGYFFRAVCTAGAKAASGRGNGRGFSAALNRNKKRKGAFPFLWFC